MMFCRSKSLAIPAGLILLSMFMPNFMRGQTVCTTATFSGTYLYILSGFTFTKKGQVQEAKSSFPVLVSGRIVLNGDGTGRGQQTVNGGDDSTDQSFFTSYTVDSNCQGELLLAPCTSSGCIGLPLHFVLAKDGKEAFAVNGDEKTSLSGNFLKVRGGHSCSQSTLNGNYIYETFGFGFDANKPILTPLGVPFSTAGVQVMTDGTLNAADWYNFGGTIGPRQDFIRNYTVNSDCTAFIAGDDTAIAARMYAAGDGSVFTIIQNLVGAPVAGWYKRQ
jgi:hypothetical protein